MRDIASRKQEPVMTLNLLFLAFKALFFGLMATCLACIEIESEGKYGWAEKAPTWFRTRGFVARVFMMGGKPLTGYHAFMFFFPLFFFHAQFFLGAAWGWPAEIMAFALYFAWCPLWDYHWFVLNPYYAGKFNKRDIWWHNKSVWIFGLFPMEYLMGFSLSIGFGALASFLTEDGWILYWDNVILIAGFLFYTVLLHVVAPAYHRWYIGMREPNNDDRSCAGIFHTGDPQEINTISYMRSTRGGLSGPEQ